MRTIFVVGFAASLHFLSPAQAANPAGQASASQVSATGHRATPGASVWVMMIAGFGLVGLGTRGRERGVSRVAN